MSGTPKRRLGLSAAKRALLDLMLAEEGIAAQPGGNTAIPRRPEEAGPAPLSFAQQRLWFLDQLEPGTSVYTIPGGIHIQGKLDIPAFERSLDAVIRRHDSLRTTFVNCEGEPVQVVAPHRPFTLPIQDLSHLKAGERQRESRRLTDEEATRPFDLAQGPLLRVQLLRLADEEHILILTMHHIISDGWSLGVLIRELAILYEAHRRGEGATLPDLPIQYSDFAAWQQQWLTSEAYKEQLTYWQQKLTGAPTVLTLPSDHSRPPVQSYRGRTHSFPIPSSLLPGLNRLAAQEGATLFMVLLAAFKVLLFRYTHQSDLLVGSLIANRNRSEIEPLIGFFVNTLVLRTDLGGEPSFRELLGRVRQTTLGAYAHQDLPFEKVVDYLKPERTLSHAPLFQVMFVLQNMPMHAAANDDGPRFTPLEFPNPISKFDLLLTMLETSQELGATFQYNTDLFEPETIERMAGHLLTLLESLVANPDQAITSLPLLTAQEIQLFSQWNATDRDYPRHLCIHQLFEQQVERTPEATALVWGKEKLSYRELNHRANQLAHHLQSLGVGAEVPVGICLERSPELIVSLLAVLKAGGAYLPLDPAYPSERLAFMIQDAGLNVVLGQSLPNNLLNLPATHFIDIDHLELANLPTANLSTTVRGENLAYVLYTSGSTGIPKGVLTPHRAVLRLLLNNPFFEVEEDETFLQLAPVAFDASTFEIWAPLLHGATLVLAPARKLSLAEIAQLIEAHHITTLWLTAGLFHLMLTEQLPTLAKVRQLLAGGDVLSLPHVRKLLEQPGERVVINGYGPTESTTFACCYRMDRNTQLEGSVPIGKPIANTRVYVLDARAELVPVGVVGELFIGGDGLARGYLNRPELTAEKFVSDPFSESGGKLYRSGDLARWRAEGVLEFVGRLDNQVKLRGFRIELAEVEAALVSYPDLREATATVWQNETTGDRSLVAYVVGEEDRPLPAVQLRAYLKERLPEYMIPSLFVALPQLPLTANGKLDRAALPDPFLVARPSAQVPPRTPLELQLVQIWEELLALKPIGVTDNFFDLGGNSLLAVHLLARIQKQLDLKLPLAAFFRSATIESLAQQLQGSAPAPSSPLVTLQPLGKELPFFCVHPAGGGVLCLVDLARQSGAERPFYGLQVPAVDQEVELHASVESMAADYLQALRAVQPHGPYALGGYSMGAAVAFEMALRLEAEGERVAVLVVLDLAAPGSEERQDGSDESAILADLARGLRVPLTESELRNCEQPEERLRLFVEKAQAVHALPPDVDLILARRLLDVYRINLLALARYRPATAIAAPVALFEAGEERNFAPGWQPLTRAGLTSYRVPGDHDSCLFEPQVTVLAARLSECLAAHTSGGKG
ncbi:non-ribosomal peptide synthetase [Gloeobacter kilaueensis]|uniref:Short chain acyl-CoA synthetase n=1 Tax=Gloeobacter kilaueensis (strain ATCC BAA-2537 / CCAP 1431/1 / ULC 316 / JS1) TaxID=1183438 RepID=U5QHU4_GLOK1|nr:non-ribosomal peptide synthetase [Gloeobacter kilaueensis]AGY58438.1 short chain acyl-CoA synthetase [Gloeobacter kilaueensis JS1]